MREKGLTEGFPINFSEWRNLDKETIDSSPIWFLKCSWGSHGRGITLISNWEEYQDAVKTIPKRGISLISPSGDLEQYMESYIMQRGLCNCHLYKERKYILRVYYLVLGNGAIFVYDDALGYAHAKPFDKKNKEWAVHVSHINIPGKDTVKDDRIYFTLSDQSFGEDIMIKIVEHSKTHMKILQDTILLSQDNPDPNKRINHKNYHLWGADYLVLDDNGKLSVCFIELNAYPNMSHNAPRRGGKIQQNEMDFRKGGFDRDMLRRMGLEKQDLIKNKWIEILEPLQSKS